MRLKPEMSAAPMRRQLVPAGPANVEPVTQHFGQGFGPNNVPVVQLLHLLNLGLALAPAQPRELPGALV
jgi:hypothetical protein